MLNTKFFIVLILILSSSCHLKHRKISLLISHANKIELHINRPHTISIDTIKITDPYEIKTFFSGQLISKERTSGLFEFPEGEIVFYQDDKQLLSSSFIVTVKGIEYIAFRNDLIFKPTPEGIKYLKKLVIDEDKQAQ